MTPVDLLLIEGFKHAASRQARGLPPRRRQAAAVPARSVHRRGGERRAECARGPGAGARSRRCGAIADFDPRPLRPSREPRAVDHGAAQRRLLRVRAAADDGGGSAGICSPNVPGRSPGRETVPPAMPATARSWPRISSPPSTCRRTTIRRSTATRSISTISTAAGETRLPVPGRAAAGHPLGRTARRGAAVRIFTGAPMPRRAADTVMMQEDCREDRRRARGASRPASSAAPTAASRRGRRGRAPCPARGPRLRPQDIGLAASLGGTDGRCLSAAARRACSRPATRCASPAPRCRPAPSTTPTATPWHRAAATARLRGDRSRHPARHAATITRRHADRGARPRPDLLTSGGVSVGEEDHVKARGRGARHVAFLAAGDQAGPADRAGSDRRRRGPSRSSACPAIRSRSW